MGMQGNQCFNYISSSIGQYLQQIVVETRDPFEKNVYELKTEIVWKTILNYFWC